jgi:uncharacterized protein
MFRRGNQDLKATMIERSARDFKYVVTLVVAMTMLTLANGVAAPNDARPDSGVLLALGEEKSQGDVESEIMRQLQDGVMAARRGDFSTAIGLWRPLAEVGNADAQYALGIMYINGKGVSQDDAEAVMWFRLAAEQGFADAQFNLGIAYLSGRGISQDDEEAVNWFRPAAEQNQVAAQFNLGRAYSIGQGIVKDTVQAHMWLTLATARGNENASIALDAVAREMTLDQIAEAERLAREWKPVAER